MLKNLTVNIRSEFLAECYGVAAIAVYMNGKLSGILTLET